MERGEFPVKFHADECFGYGYGVGYFYSNFFLYLPAFLYMIGININIVFKLFAALIFIALFISMFISTYELNSGDFMASFISAVGYIFSTVIMSMFYCHFSIGRCTAMVFIPLAIAGVCMIALFDESKIRTGKIMFITGFCGLLFSHVLCTLLAFLGCFFILLITVDRWMKVGRRWLALIDSVAITAIITMGYWVPMLEQYRKQYLKCYAPMFWPKDNVVPVSGLISYKGIGFVAGIIEIIVLLITVILAIKKKTNRTLITLIITTWVFSILPVLQPFWNVVNDMLYTIQFPSRMYSISIASLMLTTGCVLPLLNIKERSYKIVLMMVLISNIADAALWDVYENDKFGLYADYSNIELSDEIAGLATGEEYLPMETMREFFVDKNLAIDDKGNEIWGKKEGKYYTFEWPDGEVKTVTVPFVWYKGFVATDESGRRYTTDKNAEYGFVCVNSDEENFITPGTSITVTIEFTKYTKLAYLINIMGIIALIISVIIRRKRNYMSRDVR